MKNSIWSQVNKSSNKDNVNNNKAEGTMHDNNAIVFDILVKAINATPEFKGYLLDDSGKINWLRFYDAIFNFAPIQGISRQQLYNMLSDLEKNIHKIINTFDVEQREELRNLFFTENGFNKYVIHGAMIEQLADLKLFALDSLDTKYPIRDRIGLATNDASYPNLVDSGKLRVIYPLKDKLAYLTTEFIDRYISYRNNANNDTLLTDILDDNDMSDFPDKYLYKPVLLSEELGQPELDFWAPKMMIDRGYYRIENGELKKSRLNLDEHKDKHITDFNVIIKGENLIAMGSIKKLYHQKIQFIYIDPPFNKDASKDYLDVFSEEDWLLMMENRLQVARDLLKDNGVIAVHIDQHEVHYLKVLMDEIFGRKNFLGQVIVKPNNANGTAASSNTNFILDTIEYILVYAKDKEKAKRKNKKLRKYFTLEHIPKDYTLILIEDENTYKLLNIKDYIKQQYKEEFNNSIEARNWLIKHGTREEIINICRTSDRSGSKQFYKKVAEVNPDFKPGVYKLRNGKLASVSENGIARNITLLKDQLYIDNDILFKLFYMDNLWLDIKFDGLSSEGHGVKYKNAKKPVSLLVRLIYAFTDPGDIVMDFFAGSGTTGEVAYKMGRKFVLIELEDEVFKDITLKRLERAISIEDNFKVQSIKPQHKKYETVKFDPSVVEDRDAHLEYIKKVELLPWDEQILPNEEEIQPTNGFLVMEMMEWGMHYLKKFVDYFSVIKSDANTTEEQKLSTLRRVLKLLIAADMWYVEYICKTPDGTFREGCTEELYEKLQRYVVVPTTLILKAGITEVDRESLQALRFKVRDAIDKADFKTLVKLFLWLVDDTKLYMDLYSFNFYLGGLTWRMLTPEDVDFGDFLGGTVETVFEPIQALDENGEPLRAPSREAAILKVVFDHQNNITLHIKENGKHLIEFNEWLYTPIEYYGKIPMKELFESSYRRWLLEYWDDFRSPEESEQSEESEEVKD